ncbi:MAG: hypothetical protein KY476_15015 [Planctomycetes bacterium]|nr:hypothetical protein [Planctomycetota bacterium]
MDYRLRPIGRTCAASGEPLPPGSRCVSALVERDGELVRLDFAEAHWSGPPEGTIGHWRSRASDAGAPGSQPLDPDSLMEHFERLCEEDVPATEKLRYVLALLLLQKKRLKLEGSRTIDDDDWFELIGTRAEGPFLIRDQQLNAAEIEELQQRLTTIPNDECRSPNDE